MYSVIIPLFNKGLYIEKTIKSVLSQTFTDFELIVVNDGSTDESPVRVHAFHDKRIRIIDQENAGVSTARNNGVKGAKYDHIAFLDADDWWDAHYLEEMQELISKYPDAGLWAAKYFKVKHGRHLEASIGLDKGFIGGYINYFRAYARTMWMPVTSSSFIIRRSVFSEFNGFDPDLRMGEDFNLWAHIALRYKIAYLNKPLVYYNQDVDMQNRAVGGCKIRKPEHHHIFKLGHIESHEYSNPELKILLDKMRLYALFPYRLEGLYKEEVSRIIDKVDFSAQSRSWKLKYFAPLFLVRAWFMFKRWGSNIKTYILKLNKT